MRDRISSITKERFKKSVRDVIHGLSRQIKVVKQPIKSVCNNCYFDKLTNKSSSKCKWTIDEAEDLQINYDIENPGQVGYKWFKVGRCPICRGNGFIETERSVFINCLVTWNSSSNSNVHTPAGMEGATIVQLKTDTKYFDLFKNCSGLIVDGVDCKIDRPPLSRGLGSQAILIVTAFVTDKSKVTNSNEIIKEYN